MTYCDDEVVCWGVAYVFQAVHHVGCGEDYGSGADEGGLSFGGYLEFAFADHHELGVAVAVGRVGHLAGGQGGFVGFDVFASGEGSVDDGAAGSAVGGGLHGELVVGEDLGVRQGGLGCGCLGIGGGADRCDGGEGNTEFTAVDIFHADILRGAKYVGHLVSRARGGCVEDVSLYLGEPGQKQRQ
jgi:hypothetical protein